MKFVFIYSLILSMALMSSCKDDNDVTSGENLLPPGPEYVREGNYCLNVVYYIPKGVDTLESWQQVYSYSLLELQSAFESQMEICGYPDKTFNLEVNKQNSNYVKILRFEGEIDTVKSSGQVITEVMNYLALHPELNKSAFTAIFAPKLNLATRAWSLENDGKFVSAGIISSLASSVSSSGIGGLMQVFGKMCFLDYNTEPFSEVYYSLMNQSQGLANWGVGTRLLKADAMVLNQNQIFNNNTKPYFVETPEVKVTHTDLKFENEQIVVTCEFSSSQNVVGVVVYNDPWIYSDRNDDIRDNNYTTGDAVPYATEVVNKSGSDYKITVHIPWNDLPVTYKVPEEESLYREAEIRFRFLLEDGRLLPLEGKGDIESGFRYPYKIKNLVPDFQDPVNTDIEEEEGEGGEEE